MLATYNRARWLARRNPGRGRILPAFAIIGAAKCGTTSLYAWLSEHPYVERPRRKEINYFNWGYFRGVDWYRHHFPLESDRDAFATRHGKPFVTMDASPSYMMHSQAPLRMVQLLPAVKLLVCLRDPVDRAYSQFHMRRAQGQEPVESFLAALALEDPGFESGESSPTAAPDAGRTYLRRGRYAEQLEQWYSVFPRSQFHFVTMDELATDPQATLDDIYEFLGLPPHHVEDVSRRFTQAYEPLPAEARARVARYFRPHNERLYELLGRDFGWDS